MQTRVRQFVISLALLSILHFQLSTHAQETAFTYQGRLNDGVNPANGIYDLRFAIYDSTNTPGTILAGPLTNSATGVTNGLFTVILDFGANVFTGPERWLEIGVRTNGPGAFIPLHPRQKLTATPYAVMAGSVASGGLPAGTYGSAVTFSNAANYFSGNGSGLANVNATLLDGLDSTAFWKIGGNAATSPGAHFIGTSDNQPLEFKVNGLRAARLEFGGDSGDDIEGTADGAPNVILGAPVNFVAAGVVGATIAGGGATNYSSGAYTNSVSANFGFVGGGLGNAIGSNSAHSVIGGGAENNIAGHSVAATIAGGYTNGIGTNSFFGAIGGGALNSIAANTEFATIPGGYNNAVGNGVSYGFAAGHSARANHNGSFVWAGGNLLDFPSEVTNRFHVYAQQGFQVEFGGQQGNGRGNQWVIIGSANSPTRHINTSSGAYLSSGGTWQNSSDRNKKENFAPVDARAVLEQVAVLPLTLWNYKFEDANTRHLGPMAQDFKAAFGLGHDDKSIGTVDADGVALAAIQGLNEKVEEQRAELKQKQTEITELKHRLDALEKIVGSQKTN